MTMRPDASFAVRGEAERSPAITAPQAPPASDAILVEARSVSLSYRTAGRGDARAAVFRDVSFAVRRGEIVALLGKSGSGKTSLLNLLAGFLRADAGELAFPARTAAAAPAFAYVFQEDRLLPWRTARANVALALERLRVPKALRAARAQQALADVGLADYAEHFPWQLSGGMRSRVALARALALQAPLLLLDEPFGKLDPATREEMHALLRGLQRRHGFGALLVTHDVQEAAALADRALLLRAGVPGLAALAPASPGGRLEAGELRRALADLSPSFSTSTTMDTAVTDHGASRIERTAANDGVSNSRRRAVLALGLAATAGLGWSPRLRAQQAPLRIGVWATGIQLALIELLEEQQLFKKHGLNYELVRFADVNGNTLALATNRIDVAFSVAGAGALDLSAKERPIRILLATQAADGRLVTNQPGIRGIADLKGRKIGMAPAGSAGAAYTRAFLASNHGLPPEAYQSVGGGEARLVQLLVQKEIDAALLREVSVLQFSERLGLRALADQREEWARIAGQGAVPPLGVGVAQQAVLSSRREEAVGFIAAVIEGIRLGGAQPQLVTDLMKRKLKLSDEEAKAYADTWHISFHGRFEDADVASLDQAQQLFVANGSLAKAAGREYFDQSVYRDALARLG